MLTKEDYQDAVVAQSACNLSGIARSLNGVLTRIWNEARDKGQGTDYVNQHPIVVLYVAQMLLLSTGQLMAYTNYSAACQRCTELALTVDTVLKDTPAVNPPSE
jgi:hypothetical protein